jgi:hypothetical protein
MTHKQLNMFAAAHIPDSSENSDDGDKGINKAIGSLMFPVCLQGQYLSTSAHLGLQSSDGIWYSM